MDIDNILLKTVKGLENIKESEENSKMNENEASSLIKEIENKQNIINELTEKFTNIEDKLKQLEEEKINLFYRINEADRINEFTVGNYNNVIYHH